MKQISTHGFVAAGCLDAVSPACPVTPKFRGPQPRENGSIGTDRSEFRGRAQDTVQYWISAAEKQGVMACGGGHSSEALSHLMLSLSSPTYTALVKVSLSDIKIRYPCTCH